MQPCFQRQLLCVLEQPMGVYKYTVYYKSLTFALAVTKYSTKNNLRDEGFTLAHTLRE